jgi:hypothetical protein
MKQQERKWVKMDSRCRVILYAYTTLQDAEEASARAIEQASGPGYEGFDYGFSNIGSISKQDDLYWVTFP